MTRPWEPDRIVRAVGVTKHLAHMLRPSAAHGSPIPLEPRRVVRPSDFNDFPTPCQGKGTPVGWYDWYDWALVWRYWHGRAEGLRRPYLLEIAELMRLGSGLTAEQLAVRLDRPERSITRWRARLAS